MKVFLVSGGADPDQAYETAAEAIADATERTEASVAYMEIPVTAQTVLSLLSGSGGYASRHVWLADFDGEAWTIRSESPAKAMLKALVKNGDDADIKAHMVNVKYRRAFKRVLIKSQCRVEV